MAASRTPEAGSLDLSVVVAVSNHGDRPDVLRCLARQTLPPESYEILVCSAEVALDWEAELAAAGLPAGSRCPALRHLTADPSGGRAAAFNRGIRAAKGYIVLLLADDFVPAPRLLAEHLSAHRRDPRSEMAVVGPAVFPPELRADPFVRWLEDSGTLFGAPFADGSNELPEGFFFGANTSLKRRFLMDDDLFDERLPRHAWDDYELGRRLFARGMDVVYAPEAVARHEHPLTLPDRRQVMRWAGEAAAIYDEIYAPPHPWSTGTDDCESTLGLWLGGQWARARHGLRRREPDRIAYYERMLRRDFIRGYRSLAWRESRTPT